MVSLGDERVAEPGAALLYHHARVASAGEITARAASQYRSALRKADERMIGYLVDRVLSRSARRSRPSRSSPSAPSGTCSSFSTTRSSASDKKQAPGKRRRLARVVGRAVERARRDRDPEALKRIYRRLFEIETPISARLARTLGLIDRIGSAGPEPCQSSGSPGLAIREWRALHPPAGEVPRETLTRHTLVLGETGSGKTASCILPVVAAMAAAPRERLGAALIIDPKRELGRALEALAPERLHHVQARHAVLNLMAGGRWSLEDDLAAGRWVTAATRILCRAASFVPTSPARVLMDHERGSENGEFFDREGTSLALAVLAFVLLLTSRALPEPQVWLEADVEAFSWVDDLLERARGRAGERGPNALALTAWALDGPLLVVPSSRGGVLFSNDGERQPDPTWLFGRVAATALGVLPEDHAEGRDLLNRVLGYWTPIANAERQFAGVRASASCVCADFAAPSIARTLYFGCEPGYGAGKSTSGGLDFQRLVARDGPGTLVLFQPARDGLDNLVAIALKGLFFESVLDDPDRAGGGAELPLVGYVADEFHRFATSDPLHGEQSFLDTCRSFGAFCLLACQSVASIEHALAHGGGTYAQDQSSIDILWNNTASKLVFRSTDPKTATRLADLSPHRPGLAGVVQVRPVSTLAAGECYAVLADGRFERRQLEPFALEPAAPSPLSSVEGPSSTRGPGCSRTHRPRVAEHKKQTPLPRRKRHPRNRDGGRQINRTRAPTIARGDEPPGVPPRGWCGPRQPWSVSRTPRHASYCRSRHRRRRHPYAPPARPRGPPLHGGALAPPARTPRRRRGHGLRSGPPVAPRKRETIRFATGLLPKAHTPPAPRTERRPQATLDRLGTSGQPSLRNTVQGPLSGPLLNTRARQGRGSSYPHPGE